MEAWIHSFISELHGLFLMGVIIVMIGSLGKSADWLVSEVVVLSERSGLPKVVIGATIVSIGTTLPEAAVSVLAALKGQPTLALGNAVGSIICDTGLILGLSCLISPLPLLRSMVNRQGWLQIISGILLVVCCIPVAAWSRPGMLLEQGGRMPQLLGFFFVFLLFGYLGISIYWATRLDESEINEEVSDVVTSSMTAIVLKVIAAIVLIVASSWVLIPAVEEAAIRLHIPKGVIAATLVAFGTSLPELVTAITAAWKGHGDLAVGNVIGADILNVLFVAGVAAAVTPAGLAAPPDFFRVLFPSMLGVLIVFRVGVMFSGDRLPRPFGAILFVTYLVAMILSYATLTES